MIKFELFIRANATDNDKPNPVFVMRRIEVIGLLSSCCVSDHQDPTAYMKGNVSRARPVPFQNDDKEDKYVLRVTH